MTTKTTPRYTYRITGRDALAHGPALSLVLYKHSDPVDGARWVTYEDPSLIYCEVSDSADLCASESHYGWSVTDADGGVWWPHDSVAEAIEDSEDPAAVAVMFAAADPVGSGKWCY